MPHPPPHLLHKFRDTLAGFGELGVGYGEGDADVAGGARAKVSAAGTGDAPARVGPAPPQAAKSPTARQ